MIITSNAEQRLRILLPNRNRALAEALRQADPTALSQIKAAKDLKGLLSSLADAAAANSRSNALLLELLRSSPAFKHLGNFTDTLRLLLQGIEGDPDAAHLHAKLQLLLDDAGKLPSPAELKQRIADSGIFLESKLAAAESDSRFADDAKALLLQLSRQLHAAGASPELLRHLDTLLLQIDYYQLYSALSGSAVLYLPYSWDALEEGSVAFRRGEQRQFHCRIELTLKDFGGIILMVALQGGTELSIRIQTEQEALETLIRARLKELRSALREAGLQLQQLVVTPFDPASYDGDGGTVDLGFEVKV